MIRLCRNLHFLLRKETSLAERVEIGSFGLDEDLVGTGIGNLDGDLPNHSQQTTQLNEDSLIEGCL